MSRFKIPVILGLAVAAIAALLLLGASRNDVYMTTLAQLDRARARRESLRVMGFVKEGSISQETDRLVTSFTMRDEGGAHALPVRYEGVTPGLFRDGTTVIVSGRLREDGVFVANELMTKCPSKYEGVETPHDKMPSSAAPVTSPPA